jgi:hypothetical protein
MLPIPNLNPQQRLRLERLLAWGLVLAAMAVVLIFARKVWQTNDDIGMAMIAGGYGVANAPSAGLVFSNVVWGWLASSLPRLGGIEPYSLLTYTALVASALGMLLAFQRRGSPPLLSAALLAVIFLPTLATPQFTLTAGYLAVAGLALVVAWKDSPSLLSLCIAFVLLLAAGLIRSLELVFVIAVSLPFLWTERPEKLPRRWAFLAAGLLVALCIAHFMDIRYYGTDEWDAFRQMGPIRTLFTDYNFYPYFVANPEAIGHGPLSANDLALVSQWFYADPHVFTPAAFAMPLQAVAWTSRAWLNLSMSLHLLALVNDPQFMALLGLLVLPVILLRRRYRVALSALVLLFMAILLLQLLGRSGMVRVYVPAAAAMATLYLLLAGSNQRFSVRVAGGALLIAATGLSLYGLAPRLHGIDRQRMSLEAALCAQPQDRLWVAWGNSAFPYQLLYRPGREARPRCDLHIYSLGSMQLAPFELKQVQQQTGAPDLVTALLQGKEIYMFAEPFRLQMLQGYLAEHYKMGLAWQERLELPHLALYALHAGGPPIPRKPEAPSAQDEDGN